MSLNQIVTCSDKYPYTLFLERPNTFSLRDFTLLKLLGKGAFGNVYLALNRKTKTFFAIKRLRKDMIIKRRQVDHLKSEIYIQNSINNPFFVRMHGFA